MIEALQPSQQFQLNVARARTYAKLNTQTDRQTHRQIHRQAGRQADIHHTDSEIDGALHTSQSHGRQSHRHSLTHHRSHHHHHHHSQTHSHTHHHSLLANLAYIDIDTAAEFRREAVQRLCRLLCARYLGHVYTGDGAVPPNKYFVCRLLCAVLK